MYIVFLRGVLRLLINAYVVPNSLILFTLMMEAIHSSETSVFKRAKRRNIPEDGILQRIVSFSLLCLGSKSSKKYDPIILKLKYCLSLFCRIRAA
jgi:hypothetical protein